MIKYVRGTGAVAKKKEQTGKEEAGYRIKWGGRGIYTSLGKGDLSRHQRGEGFRQEDS